MWISLTLGHIYVPYSSIIKTMLTAPPSSNCYHPATRNKFEKTCPRKSLVFIHPRGRSIRVSTESVRTCVYANNKEGDLCPLEWGHSRANMVWSCCYQTFLRDSGECKSFVTWMLMGNSQHEFTKVRSSDHVGFAGPLEVSHPTPAQSRSR